MIDVFPHAFQGRTQVSLNYQSPKMPRPEFGPEEVLLQYLSGREEGPSWKRGTRVVILSVTSVLSDLRQT